jgi:prephenate dehydrogenase
MHEEDQHMKIGILGTGHIGKTLVRTLGAAGHLRSERPSAAEPLRHGADDRGAMRGSHRG